MTALAEFHAFAQLLGPVPPFTLAVKLFEWAGEATWAQEAADYLPGSDAGFAFTVEPTVQSSSIPVPETLIPAAYADIYFKAGGIWPGYDGKDAEAGVDIHAVPLSVHQMIVLDRRYQPEPGLNSRSGPLRPADYAASVGRLPQLHYQDDPFFRRRPQQPLNEVLGEIAYHGVTHPRAVFSPLAAIDGMPWSDVLRT